MDRERIIVLKKSIYRDSDLIIRGLNTQGARLSFIAPAAVKSRRRFGGGVLEATNFIEVVYQASSKASMPRLLEAQIVKEFQGLRRGYDLIQTALSLLELVDRISEDGIQHGEDLFNLLGHGLQTLTQIEESSVPLFRLHFLLKFLFQQGVLNTEPWMDLFLRTSIRDHSFLLKHFVLNAEDSVLDNGGIFFKEGASLAPTVFDRLTIIENKIKSYRATGISI